MTDAPSIAFVVATLDEESHIEKCVRSLLDQEYPADRIRVAVVDGGSTDDTCRVTHQMAAEDPRVLLLHNPRRIAASAFNIGIRATDTDLISLVSAHSVTDPRYAAVLAEAFRGSGAALVGGRKVAVSGGTTTPTARAIELATSSPLGVGSARYHYSESPGWVDTAFPGAYRRELFDEIGPFDESLVRNQDDELHLRARVAGYRMWFDPALRSTYRPRQTLATLWSQYYQYGWWRTVTIVKHRMVASPRHLAPAALVVGLAAGPVALCIRPRSGLIAGSWATGTIGWLALLAGAGWGKRDESLAVAARVSAAIACLHTAYGIGFCRGLLHLATRRRGR